MNEPYCRCPGCGECAAHKREREGKRKAAAQPAGGRAMSTKPTPDEIAIAAQSLAQKLVERVPKAFAASCRKYAKHYDQLPNQDDFFAWLEGYDWQEPEHD